MATIWIEDKKKLVLEVKKKLVKPDSLLDIGCGIIPQKLVNTNVHICCDPYEKYIDHLVKERGKDSGYVFLNCSWQDVVDIFPEKSVDSIFLLDVIEHLSKKEGKDLLKKTVKIARLQVVIFTPLGFIPQEHKDGKDAWGFDGGKYQKHKSGWRPKDFGKKWDIYACKKYHFVNNVGEKLGQPRGALYAIRNLSSPNRKGLIKSLIK